jgi:hypothetical protein
MRGRLRLHCSNLRWQVADSRWLLDSFILINILLFVLSISICLSICLFLIFQIFICVVYIRPDLWPACGHFISPTFNLSIHPLKKQYFCKKKNQFEIIVFSSKSTFEIKLTKKKTRTAYLRSEQSQHNKKRCSLKPINLRYLKLCKVNFIYIFVFILHWLKLS